MARTALKLVGLAVATTAAVLGLMGAGLDSDGNLNIRGVWLLLTVLIGFGASMTEEIYTALQQRREQQHQAARDRAEREWNNLLEERFKTLKVSFFLRRQLPVSLFLDELPRLTLHFDGEPEVHICLHELVRFPQLEPAVDTDGTGTDSSPASSGQQRSEASLWRVYEREAGYWWKSTDHQWDPLRGHTAGLDVDINWEHVGARGLDTVKDLSHSRTVGVQLPRRLFEAGVEEFTLSFRTSTYQHDLDLSIHGLGALQDIYPQIESAEADAGGSVCDTVGVSLSGPQLVEEFHDHFVARRVGTHKPQPYRGIMGIVQPGTHREAHFFPTMPLDCPETRDYGVTIKVPKR